ncbi:uncharacterized protein LOC108198185 [Daucus carota subsp. sativus]|uniref:uncharacterized protein LOC108198185 n=1 Tax=Daucus carota subsp. sativus TaxID=79200 RepID=UPI003082E31C
MNAKLRNEINSFQKQNDESLYDAWERFKELLRKCPHYGILHCIQMETFYNGLNAQTKMVVDASSNGALLSKSYNQAYEKFLKQLLPTTISGHLLELKQGKSCPSNPESVFYMGNQNKGGPYSNTYNQSWRQHPNFSWSNQGANSGTSNGNEYIIKNEASRSQTEALVQSQAASLRNLENQVGQLANELRNRPRGTLPSDTEKPIGVGNEHCKAMTFKSGKVLGNTVIDAKHDDSVEPSGNEKISDNKENENDKLHINIPLVEALEQMPNYVKFMKDILTKKRRLGEFETIALTKECSSFLQHKLPTKMKDPGSFTIPCTIGDSYCGMALCDLGASINLMPMSVFKKLGIGEVRPTTVALQLADRSLAHPEEKIEDVLVKVDKFIFPADFIVLDNEADREVPIILGRPFIATGRTLIEVQNDELTMRVQDEKVTFNFFKTIKYSDDVEDCSAITLFDELISDKLDSNFSHDPLEQLILDASQEGYDNVELLAWLDANSQVTRTRGRFESLDLSSREFKTPKPSIDEPPELELKALPYEICLFGTFFHFVYYYLC